MKTLSLRILSSLILAPMVLLSAYVSPILFNVIIVLSCVLSLREWMYITRIPYTSFTAAVGYSSAVGILLLYFLTLLYRLHFPVLLFILPLVLIGAGLMFSRSHPIGDRVWFVFGLVYISLCSLCLIWLYHQEDGFLWIAILFGVVWVTDSAAYIIGTLLPWRHLKPSINANKTWSGVIGGIAVTGLLSVTLLLVFVEQGDVFLIILLLLTSMSLACLCQIGDLFLSVLKRRSSIKESGRLIPGHGGLLDCIDSLILCSIGFTLFVWIGVGDFVWI